MTWTIGEAAAMIGLLVAISTLAAIAIRGGRILQRLDGFDAQLASKASAAGLLAYEQSTDRALAQMKEELAKCASKELMLTTQAAMLERWGDHLQQTDREMAELKARVRELEVGRFGRNTPPPEKPSGS